MLLPRSEFTDWLKQKAGRTVVGYPYNMWGCPLATFLYEKTGVTYGVTPETIRTQPGFVPVAFTPNWAAEFLRRVDQLSGGITAHQCLTVLDSL